ncbi:ATP-binding protein [Stenotrophomonas hibiscicola]|uniref:ATP-binding protein n=1 Tax=Stenotrophomonas hibiscicola TaxID=86189 RepID=UPI002E79D72B|nr:ATP-binding protein [[Pseudomonas] hibiscicola]
MSLDSRMDPIGIRPEVTMLSVLRHLNYRPWFALAEFIDNSIQSFISLESELLKAHGSDYKLKVDIVIESALPGEIVISDNAAGISREDFPRAFRAAQVPDDRTGLSEFGMGMKSAACWFSRAWSVRTKALGDDVERTIAFDVESIVENGIESLGVASRPIDSSKSYTVVTLRGLHHSPKGRTLGKIRDHLSSIYRVYLRDKRLVLTINGEELDFLSPEILVALPYESPGVANVSSAPIQWKKQINLDFGQGQKVTGFAALRETGSTLYAGFSLFRRGRLIEGSHDETYRPASIFKQTNSYLYQRLFGELHVEGFEVSHTKDGFRWEEYEDLFLEFLKESLESGPINLISQAENYRALPTKRSITTQALGATNSVVAHIESQVEPVLVDVRENPRHATPVPQHLDSVDAIASERTATINDGRYTWIVTLRATVDPAQNNWVSLAKSDVKVDDCRYTRRIEIEVSLAHPFSAEFIGSRNENIELFLRFATATCISLILSEDVSGDPPEGILLHFNYLLRGALSSAMIDNV